jgi:hypothetical protein
MDNSQRSRRPIPSLAQGALWPKKKGRYQLMDVLMRLVIWNVKQIRCNGFHDGLVVENPTG